MDDLAARRKARGSVFGPVSQLAVRTHAQLAEQRHEEIIELLREILEAARRPCECRATARVRG